MSVISHQPYSGTIGRPVEPGARMGSLQFLLVVSLALSVLVWGATLIAGEGGYELEKFVSLAGFFGVACAFFVVSRVRAGFQSLFEIPVFMTVLAFVEFGAAPLNCFLDPGALAWNFHGDTSLFHPALRIVIVGMIAFWLGSAIARSRKPTPAVQDPRLPPGGAPRALTLSLAAGLYLASFAARLHMLWSGCSYSYVGSLNQYYSHLAAAQVWGLIGNLGFYALIVLSIETYRHPGDKVQSFAVLDGLRLRMLLGAHLRHEVRCSWSILWPWPWFLRS